MKKKIQITSFIEVDINLPYFCKVDNTRFYKVYNEHKAIQVYISNYNKDFSISIVTSELPFNFEYVDITENEFLENYNRALKLSNEII